MGIKLRTIAIILAMASVANAQQPQTSTAPIFKANAKYTNGVAPGYWATAGAGLTLNISAGTVNCANTMRTYAGGTLTMTNSTTNYVYLDTSSLCVPASNTTGFTSATIPIATVVTSGGAITSITDDRTMQMTTAAGGSGTVTTTGSPASPNQACFSGATSITNCAVSVTRRTCTMIVGSDNSSVVLVNADLGPQGRQCFVNAAATVVEVTVAADGGTPNVIAAKNHAGSLSNLVSAALATAGSGGIACSNTGGTTGIDGATTCSATLQNTSLAAGDWIDLVSGTAGGVAKRMSVSVTWTVN